MSSILPSSSSQSSSGSESGWNSTDQSVAGVSRKTLITTQAEVIESHELLSNSKQRGHFEGSSSSLPKHVRSFLTSIGLTILYPPLAKRFNWSHEEEEKKIAMEQNRTVALLRCTIHFVPLTAALALVILNASDHYIGGELSGASGQDFEKLAALQFAAKIHELLMLASLAGILMTNVRKELLFGEGVPFGAIFSAKQSQDVSFLWSPALWGVINEKWRETQARKKAFLVSLMVVCTLLGVSVGPSTANLMKPRLDDWPAGGTPFWLNSTENALYPRELLDSAELSHCLLDQGDLACPSGGWQDIAHQYLSFWPRLVPMGSLPQLMTISSPYSVRNFVFRSRNTDSDTGMLWPNAFTSATTPITSASDGLAEIARLWSAAAANGNIGRFKYRRDATFTTTAAQPLVFAYCIQKSTASNQTLSFEFPGLSNVSLSNGPRSAAQLSSVAEVSYRVPYSDANLTNAVSSLIQPSLQPSIVWIDNSTLLEASDSSLAAVFILPASGRAPSSYFCCSVDARLANVTLTTKRSSIKYVIGQPEGFDNSGPMNPDYVQIKISSGWAQYLNPAIPGSNMSIVSQIASTAGLWNSTTPSPSSYFEIIVENIIAPLMANGIARASYNTTLYMNLNGAKDPQDLWKGGEWMADILPKGGKMGRGGNAFNISAAEQSGSTEFKVVASVNGYAYSSNGYLQKVQMAVLTAYILLTLWHISYSLATGQSSSSWGSAPEIATLAMNSEGALPKNTGAGIDTVGVFRKMVRVEAVDGTLHMNFPEGDVPRTYTKTVQTNVAYS